MSKPAPVTTTPSANYSDERQIQIRAAPQGEKLAAFQKSDAFVQCIIGPIGSAKTTGAILKALGMINDQPPMWTRRRDGKEGWVRKSRWLVMRNTTVDLKATTIKDWQEVVPDELGHFTFQPPITHTLEWQHADRESVVEAEVLFVGFDAIGDVRKLRGYQLTGLWIDEAKELPKEVVDMALGRLGRYPAPNSLDYPSVGLLTSNAPAGDEWLAQLVEMNPSTWDIFVQPPGVIKRGGKWVMNPEAENVANLKSDYYTRQIEGKKDSWIRQNLANEFVVSIDGRPVHPDFSQHLHVAEFHLEADPSLPILAGFDWGRTPACIFFQQMPTGQVRFLREIVTENMSLPPFGELVLRSYGEWFQDLPRGDWWGDPAGSAKGMTDDTAFSLMRGVGVECFPAATNDPAIRQAALDNLLTRTSAGEPMVLVDPRCTTFIRGLEGAYHFRRLQVAGYEGRFHDKPEKTKESHVVEAAHYGLLGLGEGTKLVQPKHMRDAMAKVEQEYGGWHPDQSRYE